MRPTLSQLPNGGGDENKMQIRILRTGQQTMWKMHNIPRPLRFSVGMEMWRQEELKGKAFHFKVVIRVLKYDSNGN